MSEDNKRAKPGLKAGGKFVRQARRSMKGSLGAEEEEAQEAHEACSYSSCAERRTGFLTYSITRFNRLLRRRQAKMSKKEGTV